MGVNATPIYLRHVSALQDHRHEIYIYTSFPGELIKFTLRHSVFIIVKLPKLVCMLFLTIILFSLGLNL
jgi:hypothetical protein